MWICCGFIGFYSIVCILKDVIVCFGEVIKCGYSNLIIFGGLVEVSC